MNKMRILLTFALLTLSGCAAFSPLEVIVIDEVLCQVQHQERPTNDCLIRKKK